MSPPAKSGPTGVKVIATNRQARRDYEVLETWEAGMVLRGSEVKSLREAKVQISDAYARIMPEAEHKLAPESVVDIEPGGVVVPLREPAHPLLANIDAVNIAEGLDDQTLTRIGQKVIEEYEIDLRSREAEGWDKRNEAAIKLAMQVKEAKSYPWPNASNIKYPLITTAAWASPRPG